MNNSRNDTNFLRFIAILLIVNSHMDNYYPIKYLGTGGALGNALFFALSSFGLYLSEINNPKTFTKWYADRIKRIYPSAWIAIIALTLPYTVYMHLFNFENILDYFGYFFYPPFWFLKALVIFYVIIFPIIKRYNIKTIYCILSTIFVCYFYVYFNYLDLSKWCVEDTSIRYLFYLAIFIFGTSLAERTNKIKYSGPQDWIFLFLAFSTIYAHKFLMLKNILTNFQFIQQLSIFPFIYYSIKISRSDFIQNTLMKSIIISPIINYISSITLEIYIVHGYISIIILSTIKQFPINIIAFLSLTVIFSAVTKYLSRYISLLFEYGKDDAVISKPYVCR
jgi:Acyltransferase family